MENIQLIFLGADFAASLAGIYILKEFWPSWDFQPVEIGVAIASGFLIDALFMSGASPLLMLAHAAIAGLAGWYLFGRFVAVAMPPRQ